MAELSKGGTNTGERTGVAVIRPAAVFKGTDSAAGGRCVAIWPFILSNASCSEIKPAVLNSILHSWLCRPALLRRSGTKACHYYCRVGRGILKRETEKTE